LRERAIRLVAQAREPEPEPEPELRLTAAVVRIGQRTDVNPDTLRGWCQQADIGSGRRPGMTTSDATRIRALEREVKELKRAHDILLAASSFFVRELDLRLPWLSRASMTSGTSSGSNGSAARVGDRCDLPHWFGLRVAGQLKASEKGCQPTTPSPAIPCAAMCFHR